MSILPTVYLYSLYALYFYLELCNPLSLAAFVKMSVSNKQTTYLHIYLID